jgi:phosphoglycerol transferase
MKKYLKLAGQAGVYVLILAGTLLSTGIVWMLNTWQNLNIDEMLYHMRAPKTGTDGEIITGFLTGCVLPAVAVTAVAVFLTLIWKKKKMLYGYVMMGVAVLCAAGSTVHVWKKLDIGTYLKNSTSYSSFIDDHYVYPAEVEITFPEQKRNLIYIFLESMETTFTDTRFGGAWDEVLIPNLTRYALEYESFNGDSREINGAAVLNKTTYTMGGLYAESMGVPLILPIDGNAMWCQDSFLPELDGLGDVLEDNGYQNTFLIGSHAMFGGRNLFYRDHGNYEIYDYYHALWNGMLPSKDYKVFWGYEDDKLFDFAKDYILEDAASGQPFNFTMLTVDTHFEDGYFCQDCENLHGDNVYEDVFNCSDRKIAEFVGWVQEQEFYENTTIVLVGDHLTMDSDFCKEVDKSYDRRVYMSIINGAATPENDVMRKYSTLDVFPTTLAAMGVDIEGDRLGLGTNLYSSKPTLLEEYGKEAMNTAFDQKSVMMEHLGATIDMTKEELKMYEKK